MDILYWWIKRKSPIEESPLPALQIVSGHFSVVISLECVSLMLNAHEAALPSQSRFLCLLLLPSASLTVRPSLARTFSTRKLIRNTQFCSLQRMLPCRGIPWSENCQILKLPQGQSIAAEPTPHHRVRQFESAMLYITLLNSTADDPSKGSRSREWVSKYSLPESTHGLVSAEVYWILSA